ncbi:N-acetylmuramoyl-L-alanine amidase [Streptomyces sp. TRM 70361]|uniref:peptidoglycan recognition protein family protein n=1 Tax=Streptomyces sp. TRM 70361 TaxID=3116553 RepID=UPI002E7B91E9|nr:N-acetylmuramoyl-L-alanine amidase [Streptomyces sp. TRM 70361]MEE1939829.1 N-acetylmuramoyl-L-alanine amidase [Streptomyces sp. TRM 70361]
MPRRPTARRRPGAPALAALATAALLAAAPPAGAAPADPADPAPRAPVGRAFDRAAEEYQVPRDLLVAVGYGETRLDGHRGEPSHANGYGVMHLTDNPAHRTLAEAAALTGEPEAELREDTAANVRGAAAVLRSYADELDLDVAERRDADAWYPAVARYGGASDPGTARLYADTVYEFLSAGFSALTPEGERVTVGPRETEPERGRYAAVRSAADPAPPGARPADTPRASRTPNTPDTTALLSADYPPARWAAAHPDNYAAGRSAPITHVVVHVTQGTYAGTISWFQDPAAEVSAHYVVRSSDGEVTQTVRDRDTAWHARSGNPYSIGIEHEGYVDDPAWFTDAMYRSSAALTRHLTDRYDIPRDRTHIVGHHEVPGNTHTDPGPNWDWNRYMRLVRDDGAAAPVRLSFRSYDTLRSGSTGEQVRAAQQLLNDHGFDAGEVDGVFGPVTAAAVRAFQDNRGLAADGVVGSRTWTALLSAGTTPALRQGASGPAVERLQRALTAALGRTVDIDGAFGPLTEAAVRDYQRGRGLVTDGVVGSRTWEALQTGR